MSVACSVCLSSCVFAQRLIFYDLLAGILLLVNRPTQFGKANAVDGVMVVLPPEPVVLRPEANSGGVAFGEVELTCSAFVPHREATRAAAGAPR